MLYQAVHIITSGLKMVESCAVLTVKLKKIDIVFLAEFAKYGLHSQVISRSFLRTLWSERPPDNIVLLNLFDRSVSVEATCLV
jgi:hypothetical protein